MLHAMPGSDSDRSSPEPIRVLVVDDHPALREGLEGLFHQEDGFLFAGALPGPDGLSEVLDRARPDVVILDYVLHRGDGLRLCFQIKQRRDAPAVVLYSAYVDHIFAVPATLAQADAIVTKTASADELLDAVRAVAAGERRMPPLYPDTMTAASSRLAASELPIAGMLFSRVSVDEIAETLRVAPGVIRRRALRIIGELQSRDHEPERVETPLVL
jgi:DNA-binding NarL/FixJ family response regulator